MSDTIQAVARNAAPPTFEYGTAEVRELEFAEIEPGRSGLPRAGAVRLRGEALVPTDRFWSSFTHRFGIAESVFRWFRHDEVLARVAAQDGRSRFRYCIERRPKGRHRLLAIASPEKVCVSHDEAVGLATRYDGEDVSYANGVLTSSHIPRAGDAAFRIGPDDFKNRYVLETPVDGWGLPKIHLSLLRLLCLNGAVGYTKAFRSEINVGKDARHALTRALEAFDNGEGYAALRQRFESAQKSWASLREVQELHRTLARLRGVGAAVGEGDLQRFYAVTGHVHEVYGLANLDAISAKRQRVLPAKCRVYDLFNFATELATHKLDTPHGRALQSFVGGLLADEYDLEGTAERVADFDDFFLPSGESTPRPSSN